MNRITALSLAGTLTLLAALPVVAHHSDSMFERTKTVTVTGVVQDFQYINPHSWLIIAAKGEGGAPITWSFEAEGPGILMAAGIRKSDLAPGTTVTVTGHPMKDGRPAATWIKLVRADGKIFSPHVEPKAGSTSTD